MWRLVYLLTDKRKRPLGLGESSASDLGVNPSDFIPLFPCVYPCVSERESGWSGNRFSSANVISVLFSNRERKRTKSQQRHCYPKCCTVDGLQCFMLCRLWCVWTQQFVDISEENLKVFTFQISTAFLQPSVSFFFFFFSTAQESCRIHPLI